MSEATSNVSGFTASVLRRSPLARTAWLVRLRCDSPDFSWIAGQHIEVTSSNGRASHMYSIASWPDARAPGEFDLAISHSVHPELLGNLEPGRRVAHSPARGNFIWESGQGATLLIGIGTGVAPLRAILQAALGSSPEPALLLLGARTEADLLFGDELEALARSEQRFIFAPTLSNASAEWSGARGRVHDHLERVLRLLPQGRGDRRAYVCGSTPMVRDTTNLLDALGVPRASVRVESYG
jgi:NAD(P)H-flavin reductase